MQTSISAPCAVLLLAASSAAQIAPIGPFTGTFSEGFETQSTQQTGACVQERLFGGRGDLCAPAGSLIEISTGIAGGPQPLAGAQMFHTEVLVELRFDAPARRFGGWFATPWVGGPGTAYLYDEPGNLIGAVPFDLTPCAAACAWIWNGWEASPGVARILFDTPTGTGGHFELDQLELELVCGSPTVYCTAGTSSFGCVPSISGSGVPSASSGSGFAIRVSGVEGGRHGLIFYGVDNSGFVPLPWGASASYLCVKAPLQRTGSQNSGGTALACDGALSLDWNEYVALNPGALGSPFVAGEHVFAQGWIRDPPSPKSTMLSDALEFVACP
jgi:hypothetical protein